MREIELEIIVMVSSIIIVIVLESIRSVLRDILKHLKGEP